MRQRNEKKEVGDHSRAINKLVYLTLGEEEKLYEEVARGMVSYKRICKNMGDNLYSEFKGKTRQEFEEWKAERALNYRMVANFYESLKFRGDSWM